MPRLARLDAPGVLHHVMIRGIERREIFRDDEDRDNLLERISILIPETQSQCYAWALMPNHAHFLFRTGNKGLSTLMRRLLTGYSVSFNRRHKRHGQLFQNRYKSIVCQEDVYLKELVRYIHLNPIRRKTIFDMDELNNYFYTGHSALMGKKKCEWQECKYVLGNFGRNMREARKRYLSYMKAGLDQGRRPELVGGGMIRSLGGWEAAKRIRLKGQDRIKGDERILGQSDFIDEILAEANESYSRRYELRSQGYDLDKIAERVAGIYGLKPKYVMKRGRQKERVAARDLLCYWAAQELGVSLTDIARRLDMTVSGVGYAVKRGEVIVQHNNYQLKNKKS
jgi:REP element-mobilizing transposase RayT